MFRLKSLVGIALLIATTGAFGQDYYREKRWSDQIVPGLVVGDAVWIEQANQHKFLALWTEAETPRGAIILGHGRGWSPDYELYGVLRVKLAEKGYSTLAIQLPVLGGGAKVGDYMITYPEAEVRYALAADWLVGKGFKNIAIVSHSLGATMANQYLINAQHTPVKAWAFISIINGLEEMFRIKIPVLDVFGSKDWEVTQVGAYEREKQIAKIEHSRQVVVKDAQHFFEGMEDQLATVVISFLDGVFQSKPEPASR